MLLDWITDPHLDHFVDKEMMIGFIQKLHDRPSDGLLVTGDIAEAPTIYEYLGILSGAYQRPIYFVLGNHDYYRGWIHQTRDVVREVCKDVPPGILNWMPEAGPIMLQGRVAIVGHGGFYDGQEGEPGLQMQMTDFFAPNGIPDLIHALGLGSRHLFRRLFELGQEGADEIADQVRRAHTDGATKIVVLTHVPPFLEASYFRGQPSQPRAAPFYVNRCLGDTLLALAGAYPNTSFEVLAGHTHGGREYQAAENLLVRVGNAWYGQPPIFQRPLHF